MKKFTVILTITGFVLAVVFGSVSALMMGRWRIISIFVRASISAAVMFAFATVIPLLVKMFLPELLVAPEGGSQSPESAVESQNEPLDDIGRHVDVQLDDSVDIATLNQLPNLPIDDTAQSSNSTKEQSNETAWIEQNGDTKEFVMQDPALLARMVRTSLNRDD